MITKCLISFLLTKYPNQQSTVVWSWFLSFWNTQMAHFVLSVLMNCTATQLHWPLGTAVSFLEVFGLVPHYLLSGFFNKIFDSTTISTLQFLQLSNNQVFSCFLLVWFSNLKQDNVCCDKYSYCPHTIRGILLSKVVYCGVSFHTQYKKLTPAHQDCHIVQENLVLALTSTLLQKVISVGAVRVFLLLRFFILCREECIMVALFQFLIGYKHCMNFTKLRVSFASPGNRTDMADQISVIKYYCIHQRHRIHGRILNCDWKDYIIKQKDLQYMIHSSMQF